MTLWLNLTYNLHMSPKQEVLLSPKPAGDRLSKLLKAEELDPILLATANLYLQQKSVQDIATELNIREDRVAQILDKDDVKKYIENTILSQGFLNPLKSLQIMEKVIIEIIETRIKDGKTLSDKDLLDWMKELRAIREGLTPKKSGPAVAVQINNTHKLYEELQ